MTSLGWRVLLLSLVVAGAVGLAVSSLVFGVPPVCPFGQTGGWCP